MILCCKDFSWKPEFRLNISPMNTKKILNPKEKMKPFPVNTKFLNLKPRLSCKWCFKNVYQLHKICVYTRKPNIETCRISRSWWSTQPLQSRFLPLPNQRVSLRWGPSDEVQAQARESTRWPAAACPPHLPSPPVQWRCVLPCLWPARHCPVPGQPASSQRNTGPQVSSAENKVSGLQHISYLCKETCEKEGHYQGKTWWRKWSLNSNINHYDDVLVKKLIFLIIFFLA